MTEEDKKPHWIDNISGDLLTRVDKVHQIASESIGYGARIKLVWSSNCEENGGNYAYPEFRVHDRWEAYAAVLALVQNGYDAVEDLYIDDDGDDSEGRTITRDIWSVRLPNIKIVKGTAKTSLIEIGGIGATYNPEKS